MARLGRSFFKSAQMRQLNKGALILLNAILLSELQAARFKRKRLSQRL